MKRSRETDDHEDIQVIADDHEDTRVDVDDDEDPRFAVIDHTQVDDDDAKLRNASDAERYSFECGC